MARGSWALEASSVMPPTSANWWPSGRARTATATNCFTPRSSWTQRRGNRSISPWTTAAVSSKTWMELWMRSCSSLKWAM
uniref:Macaca fascicularis brain cDNA clone: QtrA-15678, similar to human procollagen-lysine, 2-oxoglutarate 5-dioxygenase (lysinehydroxylase, Ehlers-Danlos syndrome type VI) (PLOD), mRNA, RefSeq: NM_0003... n=1 Tax=Macaca fascicularis TaxID=9541 RepID=I7GNI6_MACFA|nr:unnamed protein product [Macaca fascicularis]